MNKNFQIIKPTADQLYWYELASYAAPYATVASFVLSIYAAAKQDEVNAAILKKLDEISAQIRQLKDSIERKLNDILLKERAGEVLGIRESLLDYQRLKSVGILDNITTDSAQTKRKIAAYLSDAGTPDDYFHAYNALYVMLLPLRATCFNLYERPRSDTDPLLLKEIDDLLSVKDRAILVARTVGANRVAATQEPVLIDELGPVWGTDFSVYVDGRVVYSETFSPRNHDLAERRTRWRLKHEETANAKAEDAVSELVKCHQAAESARVRLQGAH